LAFLQKNKTLSYLILTLALGVLFVLIFDQKYSMLPPFFLFLSLGLFLGISLLSQRLLSKAKNKGEQFIQHYLGLTAVKMFLVLSVLTIYLFFRKDHLMAVGLAYALAYIAFLVFDVIHLQVLLKTKANPS
jgi:hypothetical protein